MEDKSLEQKELFNDIINVKYDIQSLGSFVQNDFNRLLSDRYISKNEIKDQIVEMDKIYNDVLLKLIKLKLRSVELMEYYSE